MSADPSRLINSTEALNHIILNLHDRLTAMHDKLELANREVAVWKVVAAATDGDLNNLDMLADSARGLQGKF